MKQYHIKPEYENNCGAGYSPDAIITEDELEYIARGWDITINELLEQLEEASHIATARQAAGMTQAQLSKKSGVSIRTLQKYECGDNDPANAQAKIIIALAKALGVEPKELI
jgi:ribosome-binding protein aMBF1 (putative translation factor)